MDYMSEIGFKDVKLLRNRILGVGSYGLVCEAVCDDLVCAAKVLHQALLGPTSFHEESSIRQHRLPMNRFVRECAILREIRHPNITQYLGMYEDPETGQSVLLMELMDKNLTQFLKVSKEPIPYYIQVNICLDVARALSFLHRNDIIHRDLSSNNILLIGNCRAKLSDFGMIKIVEPSVGTPRVSNTACPGTDVYMPPEAVFNRAVYTEKGDVFSFGVNIVQILTRKFPKPGDRFKTIASIDPQFSSGEVEVRASEIERRHNHISMIFLGHPLLPIARHCLKDKKDGRPSVSSLCQSLSGLKTTPQYKESEMGGYNNQFTRVESSLDLKHQDGGVQDVISAREKEIQVLRQQLTAAQAVEKQKVAILESKLEERDHIIDAKDLQLEAKEQVVARFQTMVENLERAARTKQRPAQCPSPFGEIDGDLRLNWTRGESMPCRMHRGTNACIVGDNVAYFVPGFQLPWSGKVYAFNLITKKWSKLPDTPAEYSSLVIINDLLTTVGGQKGASLFKELFGKHKHTNQLFSLTGKGSDQKWTEEYPSMPTVRSGAAAVCTATTLIVAGGQGMNDRFLKTVEVMDIEERQWSIVADLPKPQYEASAVVCGDRVYVLGGCDRQYSPVKSVFSCPLSSLLQSNLVTSIESNVSSKSFHHHVWSRFPELPVWYSTCTSLGGQLLVIGGCGPDYKPATAVRTYGAATNSWQIISRLSAPRERCFVAALPGNKLMVAGGFTSKSADSYTDTVEIASLV